MADHIFISHASKDDNFVKDLRQALEDLGLSVWVDSRELIAGNKLAPEIDQAIEQARQVIVVLSPNTVNSPWVRKEIKKALEVEQTRKDDGYRVIPLLLPGIEPSALALWFDEEPVGVRVQLTTGAVSEALPQILAALGERLPNDAERGQIAPTQPVEDLLLELSDPKIETQDGKRRATAIARLVYDPATPNAPKIDSKRYRFTAPLGPIEAEELRWYLESYYLWPTGVFQERAERIEAELPQWGQMLYTAALESKTAKDALKAWEQTANGAERRFSVLIDSDLPEGSSTDEQARALEAASSLLTLPWELLHDGRSYLFQGKHSVRVRRRLPNRRQQAVVPTKLPIRVLVVSPRPEDQYTGYIDHRASALPLVEAVENLGELVELSVLTPPTFPELQQALQRAVEAGKPFDVVHFDGHGVYDREHGLGGLCFEDPNDVSKLRDRAMELIDAEKLASTMRDYRIPLVFLEACQSAQVEKDPTASVAGKLLEEGVSSVVAMSHSVLVETARRFVQAFYTELARGVRVGTAMLAGQRALMADSFRLKIMGAGDLHLQDWFVPVLYQEEYDPQLITKLHSQEVQQIQVQQRRLSLGALPDPPQHHFQGRSRELLALERLLVDQPYAVVRGQGGAGKTTLAVELARWLVRTDRFQRAAFVSVEHISDVRTVIDSIGRQLVPNYSVSLYGEKLEQALQPIERALRDHSTLIVLDNLESILPDSTGQAPPAAAPFEELFALCQTLLKADPATRILFTSREVLPAPFDHAGRHVELGALSREDAIALVSQVMAQEGLTPAAQDPGGTAQEIIDLVEAVNSHARALVLLAKEVARRGVRATTENLHQLMAELHRKNPDDRENSLYASVELSLRRLPPEMRKQIKVLGVFHGGAHLMVWDHILDTAEDDTDTVRNLAISLIDVGLAEDMGYAHLCLDPALPPYLLRQMDAAEQERARERWGEGMMELTSFLFQQLFKEAQIASHLTVLELPNILALLSWIHDKASPEQVVVLAQRVERLLANLGLPQALRRATNVRETAAQKLRSWSHAQFLAESATIDRLLEQGDLQSAYNLAQHLLQCCLTAGEAAYKSATYDLAMAYFLAGRVLKTMGIAEAALQLLARAKRRFQVLVEEGNTNAAHMVSVAGTESGECLVNLGRLDEAAVVYEENIERQEKLGNKREVATNKGNLGTVRKEQRRYTEALEAYTEARTIFEELNEPGTLATILHQIGMVYERAKQFDQAEQAYRQALAITVQLKDRFAEARTLAELGNLYDAMGRMEEAASFSRQAAEIYLQLQNLSREGSARSNLADTLIKLQRYNEARRELQRAIECKQPYGHAAEPWKTWMILYKLEKAVGNQSTANQVRQQGIEAYLAYRRAGGENQASGGQLTVLIFQAIQQGQRTEAKQGLAEILQEIDKPWTKAMIPKLQVILQGDRDPALAEDPALNYDDAVELMLLLEKLESAEQAGNDEAQDDGR